MTAQGLAAVAAQALDDLRAGHLTQTVVDAVMRAAKAVARTGEFTTPNGSRDWSWHDVDDLVSDFFTKPGRAEALAERAGEGSDAVRKFRGALQTTLRRLIIDRYHATPHGVLGRRIDRRMKKRSDVVAVPPSHWSLDRYKDLEHWGGDEAELTAALNNIELDPPPSWSESSDREPPATTGASIDRACIEVLSVAQRPVEQATVRRLVVDRVLPFDPTEVHDAAADDSEDAGGDDGWEPGEDARAAAERFWSGLSDDDKRLLPNLRTPARQLEADGFLGLKKSAIDARQRKLELRVVELVAGTPDGEHAMRHTLRLLHQWEDAGQTTGGAP